MADSQTTEVVKKVAKKEYIIGVLALAITITLCIAVIYYWEDISHLGSYGYIGAFITGILTGGPIFMPIPGLVVTFTLGGILNPAIVGALTGLGEAIGSIGSYLTGYGGRRIFQNTNYGFYSRLSNWLRHRGLIAVFINSAIFNPLFYPFAAIAGALRFGLIRFFLICWAGRTVKGMIVAYAGYFGLRSILRWLGMPF